MTMLTGFAVLLGVSQAGTTPPPATLGEIRMHLFYQETGRLSPDISPPHEFVGANTIIGEGSAEENASDLVVVVEVKTIGEQSLDTPLTVTARAGGRVLGQRRFRAMLTSNAGRTYLPLYLNDVGCAGDIRVEVRLGRQRIEETLGLHCGE